MLPSWFHISTRSTDMSRRLLLRTLVISLAVATPAGSAAEPARNTPHATAGGAAVLADLPVLRNISRVPGTVEVIITAAPARLSLVPGGATDVYAYNGRVPGPTLEVREGQRVIVRFRNHLPEASTIHWHGLHLP